MKLFITLKERCKLQNALRVKVVFNSLKGEFWGSTKTWNPDSGNGNGITKTETESNINDRKLKNFTIHNLVQSKENLS